MKDGRNPREIKNGGKIPNLGNFDKEIWEI